MESNKRKGLIKGFGVEQGDYLFVFLYGDDLFLRDEGLCHVKFKNINNQF